MKKGLAEKGKKGGSGLSFDNQLGGKCGLEGKGHRYESGDNRKHVCMLLLFATRGREKSRESLRGVRQTLAVDSEPVFLINVYCLTSELK